MSTMLTMRHQTQIVVSPDSDDDESSGKAYVVGPPSLNKASSNNSIMSPSVSGQGSTPTATANPPTITTTGSAPNGSLAPNSQDVGSGNPLSYKYPHTRSTLAGVVRDYRLDADAAEIGEEADGLLPIIVQCLKDENEDDLKGSLKSNLDIGDEAIEAIILDLMHAHRDDLTQAPLNILASAKRPISRPSSRASSHSFRLNRPESPLANYGSAPSSPKPIQLAFRRPHTPVTNSPLGGLHASTGTPSGSYMTVPVSSVSPASSPPAQHATVLNLAAASPSSSPLSSPRFLNAKEFRPNRPLSMGSNPATPGDSTPGGTHAGSVWSTNAPASSLTRTSSNLAIATPRSATPLNRDNLPTSRPGSSLAVPSKPPFDDDDDDEFSPFSKPKTILYKPRTDLYSSTSSKEDHPATSEGTAESVSSTSNSYDQHGSAEDEGYSGYSYPEYVKGMYGTDEGVMPDEDYAISHGGQYRPRFEREDSRYSEDPRFRDGDYGDKEREHDPNVPEGMTPLDVLVSVFGSTMSPSELENILAAHGYNFEDAMGYLIERGGRPGTPSGGPVRPGPPSRNGSYGPGANDRYDDRFERSTFVGRQGMGPVRGMYGAGGREPRRMERPGRVCRYFLAGECLRADCRFSHDLDRALCRFWLRGVCAKGDQCEFMHRLPPNMERPNIRSHSPLPQGPPPFVVDPNINGINRRPILDDRGDDRSPGPGGRFGEEEEEFPALGTTPDDRGGISRSASYNDPGRTRFAGAVKKSASQGISAPAPILVSGSKFVVTQNSPEESTSLVPPPSSMVSPTPKPSPRISLRPPRNLPTIPTGEGLNKLYMTYRERPLQLQSARNACLARAADAWRRGDGAAAKRFSRDANELNVKMAGESRESAGKVVRERGRILREAVSTKGAGGGRMIGNGLGVVLGLAEPSTKGENDEMRTEVAIDLHGLHASEGIEYLEEFVLGLEQERFLGLTYVIIGEEKHTGTQDPARGASKFRLATAVKDWLHHWGYPWNEWNGIICVDILTHHG